jgi:hypothetical protein
MTTLNIKIQKPGHTKGAFWMGVICGVLLMALADMTDAHICVGECDAEGFSIPGLFDRSVPKTEDRLTFEAPEPERR